MAYLLIHRARNGADLSLRVTNKARSEETNWQPTVAGAQGGELGVPVTKKMEDSRGEGALEVETEKREKEGVP